MRINANTRPTGKIAGSDQARAGSESHRVFSIYAAFDRVTGYYDVILCVPERFSGRNPNLVSNNIRQREPDERVGHALK